MPRGGSNKTHNSISDYKKNALDSFDFNVWLNGDKYMYSKSRAIYKNCVVYYPQEHRLTLERMADSGEIIKTPLKTECVNSCAGVNLFWLCPKCSKRVRFLYDVNGYKCRECSNLNYETQQKREPSLLESKIKKLFEVLNIDAEVDILLLDYDRSLIAKPKGMHIKTYNQYIEQLDELVNEYIGYELINIFGISALMSLINGDIEFEELKF